MKNKKTHRKSQVQKKSAGHNVHIRRCHICGTVNERQASLVERCECCGKSLAPFMFCDNNGEFQSAYSPEERPSAIVVGTSPEEFVKNLEKDRLDNLARKSIYPPLCGLAVYWDNESNP